MLEQLGMFRMDMTSLEVALVLAVFGVAFVALAYAWLLARHILQADKGTMAMQEVWGWIRDGANAYLNTQLRTVAVLIVVLVVLMFLSVYVVEPTPEARELFGDKARIIIAFGRAIAFAMGSTFSAMVGYIGMNMAVQGNVRVAAAASKGYNEALKIAYRSGTITGMLTDGLGLLGGTLIFIIFGPAAPDVLLGFGFGGTLLALFMRVGGGIYTKAADVGADLVGKVEAGMEEDDPRNAAVIADLVGDNVGDCAGMAADIFESYEVTIVSSFILGLALWAITGEHKWIVLPLVIRGVGVISSIVGTYAVSLWGVDDAEEAMYKSYELSSMITIVTTFFLAYFYANELSLATLVAVGVALAVAFNPLTSWATSFKSKRVQNISAASRFGPALVILEGMSLGYLSSVWAVMVIVASLAASIMVYSFTFPQEYVIPVLVVGAVLSVIAIVRGAGKGHLVEGLFQALWIMVAAMFLISMKSAHDPSRIVAATSPYPAGDPSILFQYVLFGVSLIGVGMLSHTGNNVSMDTFGPISDNANGIGEIVGMDAKSRQIMADLDAAGNTTKAITKGVAIGSAVIAAVSLYGSFFTDIKRVWPESLGEFQQVINLANPTVFLGLLIGGALPLLFAALLIKAVNRAASQIMAEVRRQLRIPAVWERKQSPDYAKAVEISTRSAQMELVPLGLIAVLTPVLIGLLLKHEALGGFLAGVILSGQLLAVFMANAGGAWDNAKKYIEDGNFGGKGSENHKASVVGDTVGDPLKDTAGPALNPMIKVMNLISLIMAPIVVQYGGYSAGILIGAAVAMVLIIWAVHRSDREVKMVEKVEAEAERISQPS